jgi:hypothetical protein
MEAAVCYPQFDRTFVSQLHGTECQGEIQVTKKSIETILVLTAVYHIINPFNAGIYLNKLSFVMFP